MKIKNYMEDSVKIQIPRVIESQDVCKCDVCKLDILAITLNTLPPKYVRTEEGEVYTKIESLTVQFEADIIQAIIKAIKIVKKYPRH